MTQLVYAARKAEDLKLGNMFAWWAVMPDGLYPEASRILDIKAESRQRFTVVLADGRTHLLRPEMIVIVQEIA